MIQATARQAPCSSGSRITTIRNTQAWKTKEVARNGEIRPWWCSTQELACRVVCSSSRRSGPHLVSTSAASPVNGTATRNTASDARASRSPSPPSGCRRVQRAIDPLSMSAPVPGCLRSYLRGMMTRVSDPAGVILRRYVQFALDRLLATLPAVVVLVLGLRWTGSMPRDDVRAVSAGAAFILVLLAGYWFVVVSVPFCWLGGLLGL